MNEETLNDPSNVGSDTRVKQLRGLLQLVKDGVLSGSKAVETVEKGYATRTYSILEMVPIVAAPVKVVHFVHDLARGATHGTIRGVTEVVVAVADGALSAIDETDPKSAK